VNSENQTDSKEDVNAPWLHVSTISSRNFIHSSSWIWCLAFSYSIIDFHQFHSVSTTFSTILCCFPYCSVEFFSLDSICFASFSLEFARTPSQIATTHQIFHLGHVTGFSLKLESMQLQMHLFRNNRKVFLKPLFSLSYSLWNVNFWCCKRKLEAKNCSKTELVSKKIPKPRLSRGWSNKVWWWVPILFKFSYKLVWEKLLPILKSNVHFQPIKCSKH